MPHLDITVEALVHCNIDNNYYEHDSRVMNRFVSKNLLVKCYVFK